ncbi:hypothetical protein HPC49_24765 [Pyxidicoccus fallax]|uniref:Lipoprotein n=1 Tax=Pyxidicoccus fallax TaxID=394095 RepID=A0A848LFC4_9BACT|nr:hypothetical protein [Pyxidicoccus fallax]NMO17246.1 hypothetical protein [Pyxidicoccus fallax]NPC81428.1 hypothetical protein [Pyxidicoccus fallax]
MRRFSLTAVVVAILVTSCGETKDERPDAGTSSDAGTHADAGVAADGGSSSDGGSSVEDGGTQPSDDAGVCVARPENSPAACTDGCSNDGDSWADCNDRDCCGVVSCPLDTECGRRATDGGTSDAGTNSTTFPELDDPSRPSAVYECQGEPLTAEQFLAFVPQGYGSLKLVNGRNWNGTLSALLTRRTTRRCNSVTGCTEWSWLANDVQPDYQVSLGLRSEGRLELRHEDDAGTLLKALSLTVTDGQLILKSVASRPFRMRMTLQSDGDACVSFASTVSRTNLGDGSVLEEFELARLSVKPATRAPGPVFEVDSATCTGTPIANSAIAAKFTPGQTRLSRSATELQASRRCHALTGCTGSEPMPVNGQSNALVVLGNGFAYELGVERVQITAGEARWTSGASVASVLVTDTCFGHVLETSGTDAFGSTWADLLWSRSEW